MGLSKEKIKSFYKGELVIQGAVVGSDRNLGWMKYDPDNFLYHVRENQDVIRLPRSGWVMMDAIVPHILTNIDGPIVEIGMGESSEVLANHAHQRGRTLYSCDVEMGGMFDVFDKPLFDNHICFVGRSKEFIKGFKESPAVVFIDGEHTYETVKMEVEFFLPILQTGGVMFLHDTWPYTERMIHKDGSGLKPEDIYRVRQELERNPDIDVFTWPYTALNVGLTMVMKHKPNSEREHWMWNGRVCDEVC